MKQNIISSVIGLLVCVCLTAAFECRADEPEEAAADDNQGISTENIEVLAAPIALYPDVLVAQVLPAATFPLDVTLAARWARAHPDLAGLDNQPWNPSVKTVVRFPDVINTMDENLESTIALGDAFVNQQADVMDAIQRLRVRFRAEGSLVDTPQQRVVVVENAVQIVPVNPRMIYVPRYRPEVVFGEVGVGISVGPLTFGAEIAVGDWLDLDFDWHRHHVFFGHYGDHGAWEVRGEREWSHPHFERHNYEVDVRHIKNVNIRNVENVHVRNITNTTIRNVNKTNVRDVNKTNVRDINKTNVRDVNNVNAGNITRKAEAAHEGNAGLGDYAHGSNEQKLSERGQNSRESAHLGATPKNVEHTASITEHKAAIAEEHKAAVTEHKAAIAEEHKEAHTPTPSVHKSTEPDALKVSNAAAEHEASKRGATSRNNAAASSPETSIKNSADDNEKKHKK